MEQAAAYGGMFVTAFLAATILPAQSEFLLAGLHATHRYSTTLLLVAATAGNVLGSVTNWAAGRYLMHFQDRRWFPIKASLVERATRWYNRFGLWSLLFAWLPFFGDPLTLVAGILRVDLRVFVLLVAIGKAGRYAVLVMAV